MIDGLALGETTPVPLIMVVTFAGFVGGWITQVFGAEAQFASAFTGATIVTFFTFLPSFVFIFAGGPFVETTHGKLSFTMPLKATTAAVVGVIFNLVLFFAYHVFWPHGLDERRRVLPRSRCNSRYCYIPAQCWDDPGDYLLRALRHDLAAACLKSNQTCQYMQEPLTCFKYGVVIQRQGCFIQNQSLILTFDNC